MTKDIIHPPGKLGIVTYHDGYNFGAFLQVYALQRVLAEHGFDVEVVNYKNPAYTYWEYHTLFFSRRLNILRGNFSKMLKFRRAHRLLNLSRRLFTAKHLAELEYDCVVYGSDEIWNYSNPIVKLDPVYFGFGITGARKISYAPSFGSLPVDSEIPEPAIRGLETLDAISVRDVNSQRLLSRILDKPVELVLDPTFLVDFSSDEIQCPHENFILVYTTGFTKELQALLLDYAESTGKLLISVGFPNDFCHKNIMGIGPFEFLGYYRQACEVVTNMFHGTIFAVKYNKPLAVISDPYRVNKLQSVLDRFGLHGHVVRQDGVGLESALSTYISYASINEEIVRSVEHSMNFLLQACQS